LSQCTRLTDGQTDGQTDRILIARPRLHSMLRGKNDINHAFSQVVNKAVVGFSDYTTVLFNYSGFVEQVIKE